MRVWWLALFPIVAWPAFACECAGVETVKACQIYQSTPVIFRGRVIDTNDDTGGGISSRPILYRFRVLEAFKGVPKGVEEVFIDPRSGPDCRGHFSLDRDYLIYTGGFQPAPAAVTYFPMPRRSTRCFPPGRAWKSRLFTGLAFAIP